MNTLASLAAFVVFGVQDPAPAAQIGQAAPTFVLAGSDGKTYDLSKHKGKFIVLEWTNKDCPFVKKHYNSGNMQATQAKAKEMGAIWLAICSSAPGKQGYLSAADHETHRKDVKANSLSVLLDADGKVGRLYGAKTTPQIAIIDPNGVLIYNGAIDDKPTANPADVKGARNHVLAALEEAKAGKPVSVAQTKPYGCSVKYPD